MPNPMPAALTFCGRRFVRAELVLMAEIAGAGAGLSRTEIARTVCELLAWRRRSGRLKNHECRQLLERLAQQGRLGLPPCRARGGRGPRPVVLRPASDPPAAIVGSAGQLAPLRLELVRGEDRESSRLWRELLARYHYLGCGVPVGAQLRYWVRSTAYADAVLACLLWSSAAWRLAVRDRWIGWSAAQRARNLPWVVNNSRFLILPWVRVKGLASQILAQCARQLPDDWQARYGVRPLLLETLVDPARFRGTCYRAANWLALGQTTGRGRMDRKHAAHGRAPKLVLIYPLVADAARRLCRPRPAAPAARD